MIKLSKKILISMALTTAVLSSTAQADTWCHAFLKAMDGTDIQIDYQLRQEHFSRMPDYWVMDNIYVHAKNPRFQGEEKLSVVFMSPFDGARPTWSVVSQGVPYDGSRYTASGNAFDRPFVSMIRPIGGSGGGSEYHFEVAIVIDGIWLKDPVSGESNFKFFASQYPNLCANQSF